MNNATVYRWDEQATDSPMPLLERQRVMAEKMMISRITLHKGCRVPVHSHANEQISCVLSGYLVFEIGGSEGVKRMDVRSGEVIVLPSHLPHGVETMEETIVLDLFAPPSQTTGIDVAQG